MTKAETGNEKIAALKMVAYLVGVIITAVIAALALLIISIFVEVGLPTAFAVQGIAAFLGGGVALRRAEKAEH
ncbi:hypothetical protein [Shinella sp.]|uniref:hypothetical protein n=1 Tax=Shinella sp. TaxID=1870904 RepID=UPI00258C4F4C|nr:hypothetical protein [Shinella sp.]MCW5712753.1 hypothetical protein [Shinella sp.]